MGWFDWSFGEDEKKYKFYFKSVSKILDSNDEKFGGSKEAFKEWKLNFAGEINFIDSTFKRQLRTESLALYEVVIALSKDGHHKLALEGIDLIQDEKIRVMATLNLDPNTLKYAKKKD